MLKLNKQNYAKTLKKFKTIIKNFPLSTYVLFSGTEQFLD